MRKKAATIHQSTYERARQRGTLAQRFGYPNALMVPHIRKVVVHTGIGRFEKGDREMIARVLAAITGQHPAPRQARKAIASFGTRKGMVIALQCTLHGKRMYDFLDRLIHVVLPRTRDFRGISESVVDERGSLHIGIREHTVFPEVAAEDTRLPFGLQVSVHVDARSRDEGIAFLRELGFPLKTGE
ncbi:MAG: 50S ribosomal protein L5 [Parcubacteria group bacterium]|nr:50S ribosomal protein L5 [Parcubacteria group bacterium]